MAAAAKSACPAALSQAPPERGSPLICRSNIHGGPKRSQNSSHLPALTGKVNTGHAVVFDTKTSISLECCSGPQASNVGDAHLFTRGELLTIYQTPFVRALDDSLRIRK